MLVSRIFDGISDIVMGVIVDRTKSKYGKARIWLARLAIPYAISAVILFAVPLNTSETFKLIYIFLSYNLVSTVIFTAINVPYATMNALMTQNQYERTLLGTFRMLLATAGTIFINSFTLRVVEFFGGDATAWTLTFVVFGAFSVFLFFFTFLFTHERVLDEVSEDSKKTSVREELTALLKNKYWLMVAGCIFFLYLSLTINGGSAIYFAKVVLNNADYVAPLGNASTIAQIAAMFIAPLIVKRIGKKKGMVLGLVIGAAGYLLAVFVGANYGLILVSNIIKGIGNGFIAACMWGMLSDTIEYGEWKTGIRTAGLANAASSFGSKVGSGLGGAILGWLMAWGNYSAEAATQPSSAILAINTVYIYIPLIVTVISMLILIAGYKLDEEYDQIIEDLNNRKGIKTN